MKWLLHIKSLKSIFSFLFSFLTRRYESRPNYRLLHDLLKDLYVTAGGSPLTPYDWENPEDEIEFSCIPYEGTGEKETAEPEVRDSSPSFLTR